MSFVKTFSITREKIDVLDTARRNGYGIEYIDANSPHHENPADADTFGIFVGCATKPITLYRGAVYYRSLLENSPL